MLYLIFFLTRMMDVASTLMNTNKWGYSSELSPVNQYMLQNQLFTQYQAILSLAIISISLIFYRNKIIKAALAGASIVSVLVAIFNTVIYLLTT